MYSVLVATDAQFGSCVFFAPLFIESQSSNTIRHLASPSHLEALKKFWYENGADVEKRHLYVIRIEELAKVFFFLEVICKSEQVASRFVLTMLLFLDLCDSGKMLAKHSQQQALQWHFLLELLIISPLLVVLV